MSKKESYLLAPEAECPLELAATIKSGPRVRLSDLEGFTQQTPKIIKPPVVMAELGKNGHPLFV